MPDTELPRVEGGKLTKPYPINSMADVSRARVLPPPRVTASRSARTPPAKATRPADDTKKDTDDLDTPSGDERPKGGFDYVLRRNRMLRGVAGRAAKRSQSRRA